MAMLNPITSNNGVSEVLIPDSSETKSISINFEDLKNKESVSVGCTYPDLFTQATYAIRGIENVKNSILNSVIQLFDINGHDIITDQISAIYNYLLAEMGLMEDMDNIEPTELRSITNNVWSLTEVAKVLLSLYIDKEHLKRDIKQLEYAQKGVLI